MKRNKTIVNDINKMFPPADESYPVCFIRDGENHVIVSSETHAKIVLNGETFQTAIIDYYGEFRGDYPWIDPKLRAYAEELGGYWEWENPACIVLIRS